MLSLQSQETPAENSFLMCSKRIIFAFFLILAVASIACSQATWMADNAAILGKKRLNEIAIPSAHDAGTFAIAQAKRTDILFGKGDGISSPDNKRAKQLLSISGLFSKWAKTQERTTAEMLNDGIRYFDIRVCVNDKGVLMTCHGLYGASVESILEDVRRFSEKYPRELILLGFNHFWDRQYQIERNKGQGEIEGLTSTNWTALTSLLKSKLGPKLANGNDYSPASKLSEVWKAGRPIIALFDTDDVPDDDDLIWKRKEENTWVEGWQMTSFKAGTFKTLQNAKEKMYADKFFAIRSSVTPDDNGKLISLGLFSGDYPNSASELADTTNPVVFGWIKDDWTGKYPINLIWADYYNRHGLVDLAKHVNGIKVKLKKADPAASSKWNGWKKPEESSLF